MDIRVLDNDPAADSPKHAKNHKTREATTGDQPVLARRAHLEETRSPWDQHTLARDAPSLYPNLPILSLLTLQCIRTSIVRRRLRILEVVARGGGPNPRFVTPLRQPACRVTLGGP